MIGGGRFWLNRILQNLWRGGRASAGLGSIRLLLVTYTGGRGLSVLARVRGALFSIGRYGDSGYSEG